MPAVLIEVRRPCTDEEATRLIDAVHAALLAAFRIPEHDRNIRVITHEPSRFACSPRLEQPELFTLVTIDCFAGRSLQAKRDLYEGIVTRLEALGTPRDHVLITLRESATENWGVAGGQAACDVDLGYTITV